MINNWEKKELHVLFAILNRLKCVVFQLATSEITEEYKNLSLLFLQMQQRMRAYAPAVSTPPLMLPFSLYQKSKPFILLQAFSKEKILQQI